MVKIHQQTFSRNYIHPEFQAEEDRRRQQLEVLQNSLGEINLENLPEEYLSRLRDVLVLQNVEKAREDLYAFVRLIAHTIFPEGYKDGKHIRFMCNELMALEQSVMRSQETGGEIQPDRYQFFLPPGGMKSMLISKLFVSWVLGRHPTWNIIQLGHSTDFAIDNFGKGVRQIMTSSEYQMIFPDTKIKGNAAQRFQTTAGGVYFCTGAGSSIAGRRAHILISDDVISEQNAYSDKERNKVNEWYVPGARSRLMPYGTEIVVNTRWHLEDLSGFLLKLDEKSSRPWKVFRFPAILDRESSKLLGLPEGGSFWPELWPLSSLMDKKNSNAPSRWAALYMQNPIPEEGSWIKSEWIQWWDENVKGEPEVDYIVCSIDTAFGGSSKDADYTAITLWGVFSDKETGLNGRSYDKNQMILLAAKRGRSEMDFPTLLKTLKEIKDSWAPDLFIVEKKGSGISLVQELKRLKFPIYEYQPDKDKKARVYACTNVFHSGCIWLPKDKKWARDVLQELITFPFAPHDDYVDSTTQAILWMRKNYFLAQPNEYGYLDDEDETGNVNYRRSYWSSTKG